MALKVRIGSTSTLNFQFDLIQFRLMKITETGLVRRETLKLLGFSDPSPCSIIITKIVNY